MEASAKNLSRFSVLMAQPEYLTHAMNASRVRLSATNLLKLPACCVLVILLLPMLAYCVRQIREPGESLGEFQDIERGEIFGAVWLAIAQRLE